MLRGVYSVLLCLSVVVFHILYIFQDTSFFHNQFEQLGSYDRQESVMQEANVLMQYRWNMDILVASDAYTQAEKEHLYDVKELLHRLEYVFLISLFLLIVWVRYLLDLVFFRTFVLTILGLVTLFVVVLGVWWFAWDWLFVRFHELFFTGNWMFSADSFLIQSYPWEFFRNAMMVVVFRSVVSVLLFSLVIFFLRKCFRKTWN